MTKYIGTKANGELTMNTGPLLSVIIPVYNEESTVLLLLKRVASVSIDKEIIVVDDGSDDDSLALLKSCDYDFSLYAHNANMGKGAAIRTGLSHVTGEYVVIQDSDLEYDPEDFLALVELLERGAADVAYGSRYLTEGPKRGDSLCRIGVGVLNAIVRVLYGCHLTDEATCYKVFKVKHLRSMGLNCQRFEFCPEVTAKACKMGLRIRELPISYAPRGNCEGKKIRYRDGIHAIRELLKWRSWGPSKKLEHQVDAGHTAIIGESFQR